jgi:hypothetical protein
MNQVKVKMLFTTHTAMHGTLKEGSVLVTDAAFAKHLVDDCGAAKYDRPLAAPAPTAPAAPKQKATKKAAAPTVSKEGQADGETKGADGDSKPDETTGEGVGGAGNGGTSENS